MSEDTIISCAIACFGPQNQRIKCIEELSELAKELCKDAIGVGKREHIAEEIADVTIMLEQMIEIYDLRQLVDEQKRFKLDRLGRALELLLEQ